MDKIFKIDGREVGMGKPAYIIAEMSANHHHDLNRAMAIVDAAAKSGANAIKLQTYRADTLTLDAGNDCFKIGEGTRWAGRRLYALYDEAHTPWEWQPLIRQRARQLGMGCFSSPFDLSSIDFLESHNFPAYKIASFEIVDLGLIKAATKTGKPIIISTGMATIDEVNEAVKTVQQAGGTQLALLKCTSAYPATAQTMNLSVISDLQHRFQIPIGLSDHSMGETVPATAVAMGACIIEKHFTLSRQDAGPDSGFSLEPNEFKAMVDAVRHTESAMGDIQYGPSDNEIPSLKFRRSLFATEDIEAGEVFTSHNVRSIRPADGLHPRYLADVLGKSAIKKINRATPLDWSLIHKDAE